MICPKCQSEMTKYNNKWYCDCSLGVEAPLGYHSCGEPWDEYDNDGVVVLFCSVCRVVE